LTDPKITLLKMLQGEWSYGNDPKFYADWVDARSKFPAVSVTHLATMARPIGFSLSVSTADRRIHGIYLVNVWSLGDSEERYGMLQEADRILKSKMSSPGGGLDSLVVSSWVDLDETQLQPPIYRSQLQVEVYYYG